MVRNQSNTIRYIALLVTVLWLLTGCQKPAPNTTTASDYVGQPYIVVQDNQPFFEETDLTTEAYETYSELDYLGRCGVAMACCGTELMPGDGEERESISHIQPSGWVQASYDFVDGEYLYNRCHLIGWQLSAENANERNLITGTRYMNTEGMLPFENMIADYIRETGNHVIYRVTPQYQGTYLVCSGVQLEAYSVEDDGEGICFNVYCYNVQPGVTIHYATGDSHLEGEPSSSTAQTTTTTSSLPDESGAYVLNTNSHKIHKPDCGSVETISAHNRQDVTGSIQEWIQQGYSVCKSCFSE